jgi:hypothetical protein
VTKKREEEAEEKIAHAHAHEDAHEDEDEDEDEDAHEDEDEDDEEDGGRPSGWLRHDVLVLIGALALLATGVLAYRSLTAPRLTEFSRFGLSLERPGTWLPPQAVPPPPSRLAVAAGAQTSSSDARKAPASGEELPYHVVFQSPLSPLARLEIRIDRRPTYGNLRGALGLARVSRYGEVYWAAESDEQTIDGRDWVRTRFQYAYKAGDGDSPKVATGIEYGTVNGNLVYVVTFHGSDAEAERLRALIAPTFAVDPNHPAATGQSSEKSSP